MAFLWWLGSTEGKQNICHMLVGVTRKLDFMPWPLELDWERPDSSQLAALSAHHLAGPWAFCFIHKKSWAVTVPDSW